MNIFKKSRLKFHLSLEYVQGCTGISKEKLIMIESNEVNNAIVSNEIVSLAKFYDINLEDIRSNLLPETSFIARHKGLLSNHDKQEIANLYELQGILG
ncbi:Uncharacterised protein [Macrococcoides caseolyticum]|uniref:hypothetical protein n=1 Tax=Macrococcoides caseolyticum TaxID=69966 RepID=UPI000E085857|nr:hypothetical protein [Macrococcus caseolyticus]STY75528.1 Uncharacterised protein [Macrococcus caseolyticus]